MRSIIYQEAQTNKVSAYMQSPLTYTLYHTIMNRSIFSVHLMQFISTEQESSSSKSVVL